jgi:hypothetical protein
VALYRKKPVVIEAMQWQPGDLEQAGYLVGWLMAHGADFHHPSGRGDTTTLAIRGTGDPMIANPGDWIVKGVKGEFYPCKPDIFEATYELVSGP